jgi:hypothetical protein
LRVAIREVDGTVVIDQPQDIVAIRARAETERRAAGTWGQVVDADQGWPTAGAEHVANRG